MSKVTRVVPTDDGPLYISGEFTLQDEEGNVYQVNGDTWLCRCGTSLHKPFCDGEHSRTGFKDTCRKA